MNFANILHRGPALVVSERAQMNRLWFSRTDAAPETPPLLYVDRRAIVDVHALHRTNGSMLVLEGVFRHSATEGSVEGDDRWRRLNVATSAENDSIAQLLRTHLGLPRSVVEVNRRDLETNARAFHGKLVRTWADWDRAFERSSFAGAWIEPPFNWSGTFRAEVTGLWLSDPNESYGHMGASSSSLVVFDFALLDRKSAAGWTMPSDKLIVRTKPRQVVFEAHPSDEALCRVRVHGRAIPMRYERFRRTAPFARPGEPPVKNALTVVVPDGPAPWVPLRSALRSDGIFRTANRLRLEQDGFDDAPWMFGFRDATGGAHVLRMVFAPRTTSVALRWMEIPETPYTAPEEIVHSLRRAHRLVELDAKDHAAVDVERARRFWAKLTDDDRRQFDWPAVAREQLVLHGFAGAVELFGLPEPPRTKVMSSSDQSAAFATLYKLEIERPTMTQAADGRVVLGGCAPTLEAKQAAAEALRAAGFPVDDAGLTVRGA